MVIKGLVSCTTARNCWSPMSCSGGAGNELVENLSIIIISDGEFTDSYSALITVIEEGQQARVQSNLNRVAIGFFGIGVDTDHDAKIRELVGVEAERCILGYLALRYIKNEEDD